MKDRLFIVKPGYFNGDRGPLFCCDAAPIEGQLSFCPELRELVDVIYIEAPRPRRAIIELLGEENQNTPVLVLAGGRIPADPAVKVRTHGGQRFIDTGADISAYLSTQYGLARSSAT